MQISTNSIYERIIEKRVKCVCQRGHVFFIGSKATSSVFKCPTCNSLVDTYELSHDR